MSFLVLLGLAITGFVMRYVLPPGTGGLGQELHGGAGRGVKAQELWSMTRHEWGSIHFYMAVVFVVLMITHIILHWRWIKNYVRTLLVDRRLATTTKG
jgi:hypothetical protein